MKPSRLLNHALAVQAIVEGTQLEDSYSCHHPIWHREKRWRSDDAYSEWVTEVKVCDHCGVEL